MNAPATLAPIAQAADRPPTISTDSPGAARAGWQEANSVYLSAAVAWVRRRLEGAAGAGDQGPGVGVQAAADAMRQAAAIDPPPALHLLGRSLGLSSFERNILLLCAALEFDTRIAGLCAQAQGDPARPFPTFALALTLFEDAAWEALAPEAPLRYWRLIEINQPPAQPLTTSALRADERIVNFIKGLNVLDDRLSPLLAPLGEGPDVPLPPSHAAIADRITATIVRAGQAGALPVVQLLGSDAASKKAVAQAVARTLALDLRRLEAASLPTQAGELGSLARLWQRECALLPLALYLEAGEADLSSSEGGSAPHRAAVQRMAARAGGVIFVASRDLLPDVGGDSLAFDITRPLPDEQRDLWAQALGAAVDGLPATLAGHFDLSAAAIRRIAAEASAAREEPGGEFDERLREGCLASTRPRMDQLAQRLQPVAHWDDLVLPEPELRLLRTIAAQVNHRSRVYDDWGFRARMNRGLGISALFAGESGTGKTMAAEVLANALRLNLYRIDLSAVVSKYIGETEKNLRRLFDAAEDGGAILFFDEADALFGKRSEVKDSHDRYANIEINYLLQRMEAYRGLAILATNMKSALDLAFMRRLRFVVNFPFPGPAERRQIWARTFPQQTPLEGVDFDRLARLNLTGGAIHNAALNAAFLAAAAGSAVTMPLVLEAARDEYVKLERPVNEADFRWQGR
jgi:hypothetical protein